MKVSELKKMLKLNNYDVVIDGYEIDNITKVAVGEYYYLQSDNEAEKRKIID